MTAFTSFSFGFLLLALMHKVSAHSCHVECSFHFCDGKSLITITPTPDKALTAPICARDGTAIGIVHTGEAHVVEEYSTTPISQWSPDGLKQNFSPSFFKAYKRDELYGYNKYWQSGVGHEVPQNNQMTYLKDGCFFLPIREFQGILLNGNVMVNVDTTSSYDKTKNCIAFSTTVASNYLPPVSQPISQTVYTAVPTPYVAQVIPPSTAY